MSALNSIFFSSTTIGTNSADTTALELSEIEGVAPWDRDETRNFEIVNPEGSSNKRLSAVAPWEKQESLPEEARTTGPPASGICAVYGKYIFPALFSS